MPRTPPHPELNVPSRARRVARVLVVGALLALVALHVEHWRGERALRQWKTAMIAQGEVFEAGKLWPPVSAGNPAFSNRLTRALHDLPPALKDYAGQVSGIILDESYRARRGSREPRPPLVHRQDAGNTWERLDAAVREARPALQALHELLNDPPAGMGCDIEKDLEQGVLPRAVLVRHGAQALQAAAVHELHQGRLALALEHLEALSAFGRLYAQDPGLVNFMLRVAVTGLSVDVCWDALQDPGWTEPQLAALQRACESTALLPALPRTLEGERAARLYDLAWLRAHSYEAWIERYQPVYQSFGLKLPAGQTAPPRRYWRHWVFHPAWSFAWADQEELNYLRHAQSELGVLRQVARHQSWRQLEQERLALDSAYCPPVAAWRFYAGLPLRDYFGETIGGGPDQAVSPYPNYSRAWLATFKNLTLHQMVIAAVALKRYELRHGKPPGTLDSLVPAFLASVPRDYMDGKPLRYQRNADGSFTLYSVGENAVDNGGDPQPEKVTGARPATFPWPGRDWVWPKAREPRG